MTISKLTPSDKQLISKWDYSQSYSSFSYATQKGGWLDTYCCKEESSCFVAKEDENIIGIFLFIKKLDNEFRILINPSFLNMGHGKTLTKKALSLAFDELQYKKISLIVRKEHSVAIKLYENEGFKLVGETTQIVNETSIDFFKMLKEN